MNENLRSKPKHHMMSGQTAICPECEAPNPYYDSARGEYTCTECGFVISDHVIDKELSGRRAFSQEERNKRETKGAPISPLMPDIGLSTIIDTSKMKDLSQRMRRVFKWNTRMKWEKRNLLIATTEIKRMGTLLHLPLRVKEFAAINYRKAFAANLLRGRSIRAMVAASLYYSCRIEQIPCTLQEIVDVSSAEAREVRRCYRTLIRELRLRAPTIDPIILVPKFIAELNLDNHVEKLTIYILKQYKKKRTVSGKDPKGLIAAALYVASQHANQPRSQNLIAKTVGVTEVTLRSRYKEMKRDISLPSENLL